MALLKKKKRVSEIPTSSLADIAFLLLIFFLVSTTIDMDKGLGLILPAEGQEIKVRKENIANLLIDARGKVLLDKKEIEIKNIKPTVEAMLARNPKLIISVKTHPRTDYQTYIQVIDQLKQANAKRISIAE
ncbi:MAG: biopolymer transporter ExbD [Candidatus Marinimicrobia bacterium]|nr:biopolymer transporter ExbD [Candidatus Neomarinimicrobiota bacterium]